MTQAEEIVYREGHKAAQDLSVEKDDNPYTDAGLRAAWEKGFNEGRVDYLDSKRYF